MSWTIEQISWFAAHPQYEACGAPRSGVRFKDCGTLYADGRFDPMASMKVVKLEEGCRLVGIPVEENETDNEYVKDNGQFGVGA
jgi:hypothetical protein